jgi:ABC-type amino acid transport substrate-binding protein
MEGKRNRWQGIVLLVILLAVLPGCELFNGRANTTMDDIKARGKLVVATSIYRPFVYKVEQPDQFVGYDIDIAREIAQALGVPLEIKVMQFTSLIPALLTSQADLVIAAMYITDERKAQIEFTKPYFTTDMVLVVRKNDAAIRTIDDLHGKLVGVKTGATSEKVAQNLKAKGVQITIKSYRESIEYLEDLEKGRLDAVINDHIHQDEYNRNNDRVQIIGEPFIKSALGIGLKKGDKRLVDTINTVIDTMEQSGRGEELRKKWFSSR